MAELTTEVGELRRELRGKKHCAENNIEEIHLEQADSAGELLAIEEKLKSEPDYSRQLVRKLFNNFTYIE